MGKFTSLVSTVSQKIIAMDEDAAAEGLKKALESDRSPYTFENEHNIYTEKGKFDVSENGDTNDVTVSEDDQSSSSSPKPKYSSRRVLTSKPNYILKEEKMKLLLIHAELL